MTTIRLAILFIALPLGGCLTIGANRLSRDEIDFSRALAISQNQQTLLNVVRLRYAEAPTFLDLTQVISGYQAQQNVTGNFNLYPRNNLSTYIGGAGSLQLQESPTFTYAPITGEQFADTFLRPLSPATVLPLALGGAPIDVVLAMVVQSIDDSDNAQVLSGTAGGASSNFRELMRDFRTLQVAGLLDVRVGHRPGDTDHAPGATAGSGRRRPTDGKSTDGKSADGRSGPSDGTWMVVRDSADPAIEAIVVDARRLLRLPADDTTFDIVYGRRPTRSHEVAILTRSLLATLVAVAFAIDVPREAVLTGRTLPTVASASPVRIHSGDSAPDRAFVATDYDGKSYWILSTDFRSKLAFAVLQDLLALAETSRAPGAVVTIPAG